MPRPVPTAEQVAELFATNRLTQLSPYTRADAPMEGMCAVCGAVHTVQYARMKAKGYRCPGTVDMRLDTYTDRSAGPEACWPWTGPTIGGGPRLTIDRKPVRARAIWWERAHGWPPATGGALRATCKDALCVNPAHLKYTPPAPGPPRRNVGDLDPSDPATEHQQARCADLGVACPATVGEAADLIVATCLTRWGVG